MIGDELRAKHAGIGYKLFKTVLARGPCPVLVSDKKVIWTWFQKYGTPVLKRPVQAVSTSRKRPAASGAGPSEPPSKRGKQPADDDDEEEYVVKAEAVSDDDDAPPPPPAPPVLCYCERPAALLDGRWVCAQLVEGDFCVLGRENE